MGRFPPIPHELCTSVAVGSTNNPLQEYRVPHRIPPFLSASQTSSFFHFPAKSARKLLPVVRVDLAPNTTALSSPLLWCPTFLLPPCGTRSLLFVSD